VYLLDLDFAKANESARTQKADLEARKEELTSLLGKVKATEAMVERVPRGIKTFEEAFQSLETRQQKAQLQTILKAAYVY
jgi:predicted  nucleic acid-binding Zn-ribbon protein